MEFRYSDGGRSNYFKAKGVSDCVTRAVCNATGKDYKEVYDTINDLCKNTRRKKNRSNGSARNGIAKKISHKYIEQVLGWKWHPTMTIGSGCQVHLTDDELPDGILICQLAGHLTCVKDGVLYDTWDCSEDYYGESGTKCVYGYWSKC